MVFRQHSPWNYVLLAVLTVVPLGQVCRHEFLTLDDPLYVTENPWVLKGLTPQNITWAFTTFRNGFWHPLTWLSLQLDTTLLGTQAWGYHLTNLLWHLANVLLLYALLVRLTGAPGRSLLAAAFFAIHPMRAESVAWVTERKDVLFVFFFLLALGAFVYYTRQPRWWKYVGVLTFMGLSLMAKPMAVTLPGVLLLLDLWPLGRFKKDNLSWRWLLLEKVPLVLLGLACSILTLWAHQGFLSKFDYMPFFDRVAQALVFYGWYVVKTLWPIELAPYAFPANEELYWKVPASLILLGAISLLAWRWRRREPAVGIGWLWFLGTLFPVIGVVSRGGTAADRFTYIPHIGFFLGLVWGLTHLAHGWQIPRKVQVGLGAATVAMLLGLTWIQTGYWQNNRLLWEHSLAVHGGNREVHDHLGVYYMLHGDYAKAEHHFRLMLAGRFNPLNYQRMGVLSFRKGDWAQAEKFLRDSLEFDPQSKESAALLGLVLAEKKQFTEAAFYLQNYLRAGGHHPDIYQALARTLLQLGQPDQVIQEMNQALALAPYFTQGYYWQGKAYLQLGRYDQAVVALLPAVARAPRDAHYRASLAFAYYQQGDKEKAAQEYRQVMQLQPDWPQQTSQQAFSLATNPKSSKQDAVQALELALQVCQATAFADPRWLDVLGVAYAANGRFADAQASAGQALAQTSDPDLENQLRERLALYQQGKPLSISKVP
jgi:tetratricopeptide (TPR) repeat protein